MLSSVLFAYTGCFTHYWLCKFLQQLYRPRVKLYNIQTWCKICSKLVFCFIPLPYSSGSVDTGNVMSRPASFPVCQQKDNSLILYVIHEALLALFSHYDICDCRSTMQMRHKILKFRSMQPLRLRKN